VLLAYKMNGKELPPAHGAPLRAVVAGWYGMASVKWLTRVVVTDRPFQGFFQTLNYSYFERRRGLPSLVPVTEIEVKAEIARPARHEVIPAKSSYRIYGAVWAGESEVKKVEVSTDGGKSWAEARSLGEKVPFSWRLWEYDWQTPTRAGPATVMARATDQRGRLQAMKHNPDRRSYMINHVLPVEVQVR
jgi:DMSO/TMAO reductase YedYZ molybdopterin-dependent catalytic subunit